MCVFCSLLYKLIPNTNKDGDQKQMMTVWMFLFFAILSFISLHILTKKTNVTIVLGNYFASNILITISGVIINLNLKLTKQDPTSHLIFWTQKIPELSLKPTIMLWYIFILFSARSILSKCFHALIFLTALVSIELYFVHIKYLQWVHWNVFYSYLRYGLIISLLAVYFYYVEKLIHNDKEVNAI